MLKLFEILITITMKKKDKEFRDQWRYTYIGENDWIIDNYHSYNPEDDMIEALDSKDADQVIEQLSESNFGENFNLHECLDLLPERYRTILWDFYFEGLTDREIGEKRGYSKQYAHQERNKAMKLIKDLIGKSYDL